MSYRLDEEVLEDIAELCSKLTNFEGDSPLFRHVYKYAVQRLRSADSMFLITRKEIDERVDGMSEKFVFHGFLGQAADLKLLYERFLGRNLTKDDTQNRLAVVKFLLSMSGCPTRYMAESTETYRCGTVDVEEAEDEVDWGSYLREGVERWSPPESIESEEWTDDESESSHVDVTDDTESKPSRELVEDNAGPRTDVEQFNYNAERRRIAEQVQSGWFNNNYVCHMPKSENLDANVAVRWHEYLLECTSGLLKLDKPSILSEYKFVREVIWQLWEPHNGVAYKFSGNKLVPKEDVTISSVRPVPFQRHLQEFVPYTEILDEFRKLDEMLNIRRENSPQPPDTFRTFCASVRSILAPTKQSLVDLENRICKQDDTMTLLRLANFCRRNFKPAEILKNISDSVLSDYSVESRLECSTGLLRKLHDGVLRSVSKSEQDIYLCLYLESLFKYCCLIDNWLNKGEFRDETDEFPVAVVSKGFFKEWRVKQFSKDAMEDGFLKLIYTEVLQIGKNIHLLHQLGKLHLVSEINSCSRGTLHKEFVEKVLQEIKNYFSENEIGPNQEVEEGSALDAEGFRFPAICPDFCKYATEMDRLENLVDTTDGCLSLAFESFFTEVSSKKVVVKPPSLYERISKTTKNIFPAQNMVESIFSDILKSRYSASGHIVKTLLKNNFMLDRHLDLLHHVFLFKDDVIFPFYWKLFDQLDNSKEWGNNIWLTSHLQDVIMDIHPYTYQKLSVIVKDSWRDFLDDPLKGSTLFRLQYQIEWPITLIITDVDMQMYKELFFFILQIKWALYTLNHLHFTDIEPKKAKAKDASRVLKLVRGRLKVLRFAFVNIFSSIQHYILGYTYAVCSAKFVDDYNCSYSVDTLIDSHNRFITELHRKATYLRDYNESSYGYYLLLYNVRKLRRMWKDIKNIDEKELRKCEESYKRCHKMLFDIIHPSNYV